MDLDNAVVPIRYPIIFSTSEQRDVAFKLLSKHGLGASVSYPLAVTDYPEFEGLDILHGDLKNSRAVAACILTLPVHMHVTKQDIFKAYQLIKQVL